LGVGAFAAFEVGARRVNGRIGAGQRHIKIETRGNANSVGPRGCRRMAELAIATSRLNQCLAFVHGKPIGHAKHQVQRGRAFYWATLVGRAI
jgi:hypothetical protein